MKKKVLFVCIHNSARSQMAEEILRKLASNRFEVESAGLEPGVINPLVVEVLKEQKIDISHKKTQSVSSLIESGKKYDYVVTVCDEASAERCPVFPGDAKRLHWGFEDPSKLQGTNQEKMQKISIIRDQIKDKIKQWIN
ncbi:MAG: arsenate reductase ArsC [Candidatus Omnitrophica bacterium]|nr:arsenate reductase ArsC [Candidatus Omnitrophota bacterium]